MAIDLVARLSLDDQLSKRMGKVTKGVMAGMAVIGVGVGVAINKFVEFDNQMRKAGAIAGATTTEFNTMKEAAIDMGAQTSKNATEVAESMAELAAKGFDANQTIAAMPGIIAASEASGESLAIAADTVSSALNIWGLEAAEAGHVADVLAMAANVSAAGIGDLQQAFKYAGAPAAALGITMEEVAASIGIMTDAGLDGSGAGTSLRTSLLKLNNPAKAQLKIMDKLGFSLTDSAGEAKSLSQMVGDLTKSTKGLSDADKVATIGKLVGTEAVSGFLALMAAGPKVIDEMSAALVNSDGAAAKTAAEMMAGIGGALEALGGAIDSFALRIGDKLAPYITILANKLSDVDIMPFIDGFTKAVDVAVAFAKAIAGSWGSIKGVVLPIVKALVIFGAIIATIAVGTSVFAAIGTAIAFLVSPVALVALGITALVLGFQAAYKHSEGFRKAIDGVIGTIKGLFAILSGNSQEGSDIMRAAGLDISKVRGIHDFAKGVKDAFGKVSAVFSGVSKIFGGEHKGAIDVLAGAGFSANQIEVVRAFGYGLKTAFDRIKTVLDGLGTLISGGGSSNLLEALGFSPAAIASIQSFVEMVKTKIGEFAMFLAAKWEVIKPGVMSLLAAFMSLKDTAISIFTTLWGVLSPIFSAVMNALTIVADIAVMVFKNIIVPAVLYVISVFQMWWKIVGPILALIGSAIGVAFAILKVAWDTIIAPFANFLTTIFKAALESVSPLIEGIGGMFDWLGGIIKTIAGWFDTFTSALGKFKVPNWLSKLGGGGTVKFEETTTEAKGKSNYHGIDYVPKNNYSADLHRGEAVLTAAENKERKQGGGGSNDGGLTVVYQGGPKLDESDMHRFSDFLLNQLTAAEGGGGY
ncbi:phage tail tape measure protein [Sporosarcina psychrophila]|uniref:TP901 family phage tail tape measure protein n=1 Tax=Sporosarcina psychrophila TaxID=1476 RepID=A0ABV2KBS3_SPOPS